jgi:7,8-dihydropterin-6-yl-methyl-4-(beta-D-ribofuranosyl)aminobenzene 5'-phosphate synthase
MLGSAHGLSLYIETPKHKILFDMGPDEQFLSNAEKLGVDLKAVDLAILSHGHYDHGGGLKAFCQLNDTAKICLRKGSFGDYVALEEDGSLRYIGLDPTLQAYADRLVFTEERAQPDEELLLFSDVPDTYGALSASAKLKERQGANLLQDRFLHEQDLLITAEGKTVLVSGCSHRGIVNILRSARALGGEAQFDAVAGHELRVDDGRGVVARVFALEERLFHGGLAQIAFGVALGDARVHGVFEEAAGDMHFLPYLGEDHGKAGVLADGAGLGSGDVGIFQKLAEHVAPGGGGLAFLRAAHGFEHGPGHTAAGLDGEGGHSVAYGFEGYLSHGGSFA